MGDTRRDMGFDMSSGNRIEIDRNRIVKSKIGQNAGETYWQRMRKQKAVGGVRKKSKRVSETDKGKEEILNIHPLPGYGPCELR